MLLQSFISFWRQYWLTVCTFGDGHWVIIAHVVRRVEVLIGRTRRKVVVTAETDLVRKRMVRVWMRLPVAVKKRGEPNKLPFGII